MFRGFPQEKFSRLIYGFYSILNSIPLKDKANYSLMKKLTLAVSAALAAFTLHAQTIVFHEGFEPADSVVASGTPLWGPDLTLQTQGLSSYKNQVGNSTQNYLTTNAFSTVGNTFVLLDFDQICKIEYNDAATIEVSNDNGNTWTALTYTQYLGSAPFQALGNRFASSAYSTWAPGNNTAVPTNTWWKHEIFDLSAQLANASQCMIRFKLNDANNNGGNSNYGWVLDNLIVTASPSELFPPVIIQLNPVLQNNVYSLGPFTINDSITDASGISAATLFYTLNSGPVQTVPMTNVSGNHWQGIIPAAADSDTICYHVQAWDASPANNTAILPTSGCTQFVVHAGITFPFYDDFEGSTLFTVNNISGSQWQLGYPNYGLTTGAHSPSNAWDVDTASGYLSNTNTELYSPVFDFSTVQHAKMSFWRNNNSESSWDGTRVDYTTDGINWNVLGTVNDPRGTNWYTNSAINSSGLPAWDGNSNGWVKSEYVLDTLDNTAGPVQFRFVFTSDGSVEYDGASIDDFLIRTPSPQDAAVTAVISPDVSSCLPQGNIPLSISILNDGSDTINGPFSLVYVLDNGSPVTESYTGSLIPLQTDTFTFATLVNNTAGAHTLLIYADVPGDGWHLNDTIVINYTTAPGVNVPYFNDFESGPQLNDFCTTNTAQGEVFLSTGVGNNSATGVVFDATNSLDWDWGADTITTSQFYIWNPSISDQQRANARLIVNTTGYTDLVLEFDAKLLYMWANEYTNFRVKVNGQMITPHLQPNNATTPYTTYRYMLTQFLPAPFLTIDFESKVTYDAASTGTGIYMDNVHIYHPDSLDVGVVSRLQPSAISIANNPTTVAVAIRNFGTSTVTSIPVAYQVDLNAPVVETWTGSLAPNATTTYTFTTTFNSPSGNYNLCTWTQLVGDTAYWNDSLCGGGFGMGLFPVPFSDNFDGPQNFAAVTTYTPSWELGNPQAPLITGTHSGPNAWEVNLNGEYAMNSNEYLYSPFFDFSNATDVELRFWQWYNCDNFYDGGRVEYSTDGGNTWTVLGIAFDPNGVSWYNQSFLQSSFLPGWSGNGGGYFQSKYDLSMFNNFPTPVQFRYVFTSDNSYFGPEDGWAIDDFELFVPVDAATNTMTFNTPASVPMPGSNNVNINVKNTGLVPLNTVSVTLQVDNTTIVTDPLTFATALAPGAQQNYTFSLPWTGATPGLHTVKCWTSGPNGYVDTYHPNDTTTWIVSVMDTFATYPYCNNFETNNGIPPLTTMNAFRYTNTSNSWEQGTPAKNIIQGAHGGSGAWMTELTLNYLRNDSSALFLPVFTVDTVHCYHLEFWTRYLTPVNADGGIVEFSFDNGQTWQHLGQVNEPNWYMNATATGLGSGYQPNFGGTSNGWVQMQHDIRFSQAGQVMIRFRFGSDNSIESEGWAIDDVCFSELPPCVLAVPEIAQEGLNMESYPNPAGTTATLMYNLPESGNVRIVLHDMLGQEISTYEGDQLRGINTWTVDVSTLPEGVYFYELDFGTQKLVQKMIVSH